MYERGTEEFHLVQMQLNPNYILTSHFQRSVSILSVFLHLDVHKVAYLPMCLYLIALALTVQIIMFFFLIAQFSPKHFMWIEHKGHWTWDCPFLVAKINEYGLLPPSNLT
jgi:hypothetical protein